MGYSAKLNVQMLIVLLKEHGIKKIVISPGTTNVMFVASIQNDPYFELYSSADERSASYIACGLAAESGEIIGITCTGATASRNYLPGLTEAYYRQLPLFVITFQLDSALVGNLTPQVIDRSVTPNDTVKMGLTIPEIKGGSDAWKCNLELNKAILELTRGNPGPVHINIKDDFSYDFTVKDLPKTRVIKRIDRGMEFPDIRNYQRIGIFIGSHNRMSDSLTKSISVFCSKYNAVVLTDHSSNYYGECRMVSALVAGQEQIDQTEISFDLVIDIGGVSGDYYNIIPSEVWRIDPEGIVQDRFGVLKNVFAINEIEFFRAYNQIAVERGIDVENTLYPKWKKMYEEIYSKIYDLPFSNIWCAKKLAKKIPESSTMHYGILNSLRAWNFFEVPGVTFSGSNVGGFGIDGGLSTLIGASLVHPDKLYYLCIGDLAFFYDMNSLGNRHINSNLRILVVNNGCGTEFKHYSHPGNMFGDDTNKYIAAAGHYGKKSKTLLRHYAEDLGFLYLKAENKEEFEKHLDSFTKGVVGEKSIIFEVFTSPDKESEALKKIRNIVKSNSVKQLVKNAIGTQNVNRIMSKIKR